MLLGEYEHTIDDKNRLTLPAKFREAFADGVVLTRGFDGCLDAFTREAWRTTMEVQLAGLNPFNRESRQIRRLLLAGATEGELDKQGRMMIPQRLMEHAKLGREVIVAGVLDRLEIWNRPDWRRRLDEVEGSAEHVAERLAAQRD